MSNAAEQTLFIFRQAAEDLIAETSFEPLKHFLLPQREKVAAMILGEYMLFTEEAIDELMNNNAKLNLEFAHAFSTHLATLPQADPSRMGDALHAFAEFRCELTMAASLIVDQGQPT